MTECVRVSDACPDWGALKKPEGPALMDFHASRQGPPQRERLAVEEG